MCEISIYLSITATKRELPNVKYTAACAGAGCRSCPALSHSVRNGIIWSGYSDSCLDYLWQIIVSIFLVVILYNCEHFLGKYIYKIYIHIYF